MKKLIIISLSIFIVAAIGCKKNSFFITERTEPTGKSLTKLVLCNMTSPASTLTIFDNGVKISPALGLSTPYPFPGGGFNTGGSSNGDYLALNPGVHNFELKTLLPGLNNVLSNFASFSQTLEADKKYSIYTADSGANFVAVLALDNFTTPADSGKTAARFVNMIPNAPAVDFYQNSTLIASNVKYKEFTDFMEIPASVADTFAIRLTGDVGGPALTAKAYYRLVTNTNQRALSFVARGFISGVSPKQAAVSVVVNR